MLSTPSSTIAPNESHRSRRDMSRIHSPSAYDLRVAPEDDNVGAVDLRARVVELERVRELQNAIANYAPSLLCLVDVEGRVRPGASNIAFERLLGYEPGATGGDFFWEKYVPADDAAAVRSTIEDTIANGTVTEQDGRWLTTRRTRRSTSHGPARRCPTIAEGQLYLICGTDITERKRQEEEVRTSRTRIVTAADEARRRLERDLHDGAQQRLVVLLLSLRALRIEAAHDSALQKRLDDGDRRAVGRAPRPARAGARHPSGGADRARPPGRAPRGQPTGHPCRSSCPSRQTAIRRRSRRPRTTSSSRRSPTWPSTHTHLPRRSGSRAPTAAWWSR